MGGGVEGLYQLPARRSERRRVDRLMWCGVVGSAVLACWLATQYVAWRAGWGAGLGEPIAGGAGELALGAAVLLVTLAAVLLLYGRPAASAGFGWFAAGALLAGGEQVYRPYAVLLWDLPPGRFSEEVGWVGVGFFVALAGPIVWWASRKLKQLPRTGDTHGSAHFATVEEVEEAGLLARRSNASRGGSIVGRLDGRWMEVVGDEHVLVFAPPGAGKSAALAVPTLLNFDGSVVVLDVKGELFELTSGYRAEVLGQHVLRWGGVGEGTRFNPLAMVPEDSREIAEVQGIAEALIPAPREGGDTFWSDSARQFLVGVILHVLYVEPEPTLGEVRKHLQRPMEELLGEMMTTSHTGKDVVDEVRARAQEMLELAPQTRSSILRNAQRAFGAWADPAVVKATSGCDFIPEDLVSGQRPVSLYLTVPAADVERLGPVLGLIVRQLLRFFMSQDVAQSSTRHKVLLLLDELPILGRMSVLESAGAVMRGYGVLLYLIVQSQTRLKGLYGPYNTLAELCPVHVCLGSGDVETAQWVSRRLGRRTVETERTSLRSAGKGRRTVSDAELGRSLLEPDEVARLPKDRLLVLPMGRSAILGQRRMFFEDEELLSRTEIDPPELAVFEHKARSGKVMVPEVEVSRAAAGAKPPGAEQEELRRRQQEVRELNELSPRF